MAGKRGKKPQTTPLYARKTTQLPSSLKDELVSLGKIAAPKVKKQNLDPTTASGRKQLRKQDKQVKGNGVQPGPSRATSSTSKPDPVRSKRPAEQEDRKGKKRQRFEDDDDEEEEAPIKRKAKQSKVSDDVQATKEKPSSKTPLQKLLDKNATGSSGKLAKKPKRVASGSASTIEEQEDAEIAWLEAQLGLSKNPKSRKEFEEDGLDDILDDLEKLDEDLFGAGDDSDASDAAEDEDEDEGQSDNEDDDEDGPEDDESLDGDSGFGFDSEEELLELSDEDGSSEEDDDETAQSLILAKANTISNASAGGEEESNIEAAPSKYVPPALRRAQQAAASTSTEVEDPKLRRQLMGLLNRLSPASFPMLVFKEGDSGSLNAIYLSHPRAIVSKLLTAIIPEIVSAQGDGIGETQIVVLSALVKAISSGLLGGMTVSGGTEFGATLVDHLIKLMDKESHNKKERSNLIHFLAMLYNMQVVACTLLYDMIKEFISGGLSEDNVEALVKIVRVSGPQLRHDDPTSLKQIIQLVNEQQKSLDSKTITVRTKFMIEQLSDLKNNKIKPASGVAAEAEGSLKKYISNLAKKSGHEGEPLRMSLADLRSADQKGKWWLVGAAWSGNPLVDQKEDFQNVGQRKGSVEDSKEAALLKLARKQGMNTETRRQVFVAVMGAEDYIDAAQRVSSLGLKEVQQREVVRVLLHCLGNEKAYNPFYTLVVARLLGQGATQAIHSYQITLQYALWDFFRSLGEEEVGGASMAGSGGATQDSPDVAKRKSAHYARAYAWWCAKAGLSLNILKPLPFLRLLPASNKFLGNFFTHLFISTQTNSPLGNLTNASRRDASAIEKVFLQLATHSVNTAQGVGWYLNNSQSMRKQAKDNELIAWGVEVAMETLQASENLTL